MSGEIEMGKGICVLLICVITIIIQQLTEHVLSARPYSMLWGSGSQSVVWNQHL